MKKMKLLSFIAASSILATSIVQAGVANVEWSNSDDYRDIRPANETKKRFKERTFKALEAHLVKLAEQLPEGFQLKLKVTDIDLAGNVEFGRTQPIRIVRQMFSPSMDFEYQLLDAKNEVVKSESVELKDMNFLSHLNKYKSRDSYAYEKLMLDKWFENVMAEYIQTK